ncbi:hypothetical protein LZ016_08865 [Sphingomonas sp. SM33]|uniref:DUF1236 domain-containing protein n=1 Tax=Sphingomonas telluris TaxID=2907998 RepID=A0ABS9VMM0_9SPHN|nr:hypothetical protein [Sphingomonas telluris]MCH8616208.1 hypothetical protein [Sphingomonas telluris]
MEKILLLAAIATLASASPALAKPGHGNSAHGNAAYGTGGCPPGLAKKNAACMPPGQYKKLFEVGQRVPSNYNGLIGYGALPYSVRDQYSSVLDPRSRYIYDQGYLYRVDPTTMIVSQILQAVLRP